MSSPDSREINLVRCLKCGKILKCSRYDTAALLEHIRTDHPEVDIVDTDTKRKRTFSTTSSRLSPKKQVNKSKWHSRPEDEILEYRCSDKECDEEKYHPHNGKKNVSYENTEEDEESIEQWPKQPQYVKDVDMTRYAVTSEILEKYPEIKECEYYPHNANAQVVYTRRYKLNAPSTRALQQPFQQNLYCTSIEKWCPANGTIHCPKCGCNKRPLIKTKTQRFTHNECGACCLLSCWPFCFLPWLLPPQNYEYLHCANCKTFLGLYDRNTNCIQPNRLYATMDQDEHRVVNNENHFVKVKPTKRLQQESPPSSSVGNSANSKRLPKIVIDGKELPPETVARIQKLKKYSSLAGIDLDALTSPTDIAQEDAGNTDENEDDAPSSANVNKQNVNDNV